MFCKSNKHFFCLRKNEDTFLWLQSKYHKGINITGTVTEKYTHQNKTVDYIFSIRNNNQMLMCITFCIVTTVDKSIWLSDKDRIIIM